MIPATTQSGAVDGRRHPGAVGYGNGPITTGAMVNTDTVDINGGRLLR